MGDVGRSIITMNFDQLPASPLTLFATILPVIDNVPQLRQLIINDNGVSIEIKHDIYGHYKWHSAD
jgi:hypothetical protein